MSIVTIFPDVEVYEGRPFDFWGGYGWFGLGDDFFPKPLEIEYSSPTYNNVNFFLQRYSPGEIIFSG